MKKKPSTSKHATVKIGDYTVPLIGIPPSATQDTCARCGSQQHLSQLTLKNGQFYCQNCL